jgi:hypothetical protein
MVRKEMLKHWRKLLDEAKPLLYKPKESDSLRSLIEQMRSGANGEQIRLEGTPTRGDETNYRLCVNTICEEFSKEPVPSGMELEASLGRIEEAINSATG